MTRGVSTRSLFATLVREEWRLHAQLFGGGRFAGFPLLVATLVAAGTLGLTATGTPADEVLAGVHLLTLAFGLYSGTAGFVGSDALEDVLGDVSLVLSVAPETLPISRRRLLGVFLVKDAGYYGLLFVLPIAVGVGAALEPSVRAPLAIGGLWASLLAVFFAGMTVTVAGISLRTNGVPGWLLGLIAGFFVVGLWLSELYAFLWRGFTTETGALGLVGIAGLALSSLVVGALALAAYDTSYAKPTKARADRLLRFERVRSVLGDEQGLLAKSLIDLGRSTGGFAKPLVSTLVLFAVVSFLVAVVADVTGVAPAPGIFFGGVLGLSAFTTYNWLTQFDSLEEYLTQPIRVEAVFSAKLLAFAVVSVPTVSVPYLAAVVWFEASALDALVGALVLAGYSCYYYGLTVWLAGFDPNEFLFDGVRFAAFTAGVAIVLVPTLVAGFVVVPPTATVALALGCAGLLFGAIGVALSSRAGARWAAVYRAG